MSELLATVGGVTEKIISTTAQQLLRWATVPERLRGPKVGAAVTLSIGGSWVPIFKKGSAGTVANYRPISLTCVPCKIMERLISSRMLQFFLQ